MLSLCIDAGNSRLKWGICRPGERTSDGGAVWLAKGILHYADDSPTGFESLPVLTEASVGRIIACNVAGERVRQGVETLAAQHGLPLTWLQSRAAGPGVVNGYDRPAQLGADRWAALIGARAMQTGRVLVAVSGTATTLDLLEDDGRFAGGLILPGLRLMRAALGRHTAQLPDLSAQEECQLKKFATNTGDAIFSGALSATLGAIERQWRLAGPGTHCLLSGGAAPVLAPWLDPSCRVVDNLVLEGLAVAAES